MRQAGGRAALKAAELPAGDRACGYPRDLGAGAAMTAGSGRSSGERAVGSPVPGIMFLVTEELPASVLAAHERAARAAGTAGLDPDLIPFAAVLSLIRGHLAADTCCPHCGKRPASGNDPVALLIADILAQPHHRQRPARTSGRTPFQRQNWHTEEVSYTITIVPSNLPRAAKTPRS